MKTRTFGGDGLAVSEVGLGCWQIGGGDWGEMSEDEALAILQGAVASGITLFDTADVYGGGRSELLIGRFLKETPRPVFVATKLGRSSPPGWPGNFTREAAPNVRVGDGGGDERVIDFAAGAPIDDVVGQGDRGGVGGGRFTEATADGGVLPVMRQAVTVTVLGPPVGSVRIGRLLCQGGFPLTWTSR